MINSPGRSSGPEPFASVVAADANGAWHAEPLETLLARLETGRDGLTASDAADRLRRFGPNAFSLPAVVSPWKILVDQFRSVVVLLLLAAAAVALLLGHGVDAAAVMGVLVINASIGLVTEYRARGAMAALLGLEVPRAIVMRGGRVQEVDSHTLVPGDVVLLEAGRSVPADCRLLASTELRTNEAALTGESLPVDKLADAVLPAETTLAEQVNSVFMSTTVVAGSGRAIVVATGMSTEVGHIGTLVGGIQDERTPLEDKLDALGRRLVWVTLLVTAVVVAIGVLRGEDLALMLQTGIALAIAAVPEGLPAVSTITLAVGVARMAKRNALVRRLPAVEALGAATIVCTDKTGTLTAGEMTVTSLWTADRDFRVSGAGYRAEGTFSVDGVEVDAEAEPALRLALQIGALANRAALIAGGDGGITGDPTEAALLVAARKGGLDRDVLLAELPETGEVPFSSERMLMATFHAAPDGAHAFVKGAPARVIERCTKLLTAAGEVDLDEQGTERLLGQNRDMAASGLRVLALALGRGSAADETALHDLTLIGLVGMSDPPAAGVRETIARFQLAGIRTVMLTGDQRLTAEAVARNLGILRAGDEVVEGSELRQLSPEELKVRVERVSALSRVSPEDKLHIIEAFQARGEIVAMLGDGVNDAAALKRADIGVAMGMRGTDVAKEAASVVLQDDRFQTIGAAVEEGRVIYDNIRKFVFYLFSCNLAEVLVILGASLAGLPQPLAPLQILWLNLVTDTFPALALAVEPGEPGVMSRPPESPREAILSTAFLRRISLYAGMITLVTLGAFVWALNEAPARAGTVALMTLAFAQVMHLGTARSSQPVMSVSRALANRWAVAAMVLTIALQILAVYFAPLASLLGVVRLPLVDWFVIVPLAVLPAVVGQGLAWWRTRHTPALAAR